VFKAGRFAQSSVVFTRTAWRSCAAKTAAWSGAGFLLAAPAVAAPTNSGPARWEAEIHAFEASDATNPPPRGAIVFVGSSSIRQWITLAQDFPGFKVINRGFGGSQLEDSAAFAHRLVIPHQPKAVVLYAGDNDIAAGKSPRRVLQDFRRFVERIHAALPQTRILFISIKPSPARWHLVNEIKAANQMLENFCQKDKRLVYVDVFKSMLGADGKPRAELFVEDKLHLNRKGYELWASILRPRLLME